MPADAQPGCYIHQRMNICREHFYGIGVVRYTRAGVPRLASSTNKYGLVGRTRLVSTSQFVQPVDAAVYSIRCCVPASAAYRQPFMKPIPVNLDGVTERLNRWNPAAPKGSSSTNRCSIDAGG